MHGTLPLPATMWRAVASFCRLTQGQGPLSVFLTAKSSCAGRTSVHFMLSTAKPSWPSLRKSSTLQFSAARLTSA